MVVAPFGRALLSLRKKITMSDTTYTQPVAEVSAQKNGLRYLHLTWLVPLWAAQYSFWLAYVTAYASWRMFVASARFAMKFGIVILLFSIVGWILIPAWLFAKLIGVGGKKDREANWPKAPTLAYKHLLDA